ncbi:hypothetical protein C8Q76DRAFT_460917 [Earliella scabrosa]|nr:hypothetical protein C8Q76DRAFT_460917 [Earliella scabrosa]
MSQKSNKNRVKLVCHHSSWIALHMAPSPPRYHSVLRQLLGFDGAFDFDFGFDLVLLFATSLMLCAWMSLPPLVTHLPVITLCPLNPNPLCHPSASPPPHHHSPASHLRIICHHMYVYKLQGRSLDGRYPNLSVVSSLCSILLFLYLSSLRRYSIRTPFPTPSPSPITSFASSRDCDYLSPPCSSPSPAVLAP